MRPQVTLQRLRLDTVVGDEGLGIRVRPWNSRRGDGLSGLLSRCDRVVQVQKLLKQVLFRIESVGIEHGRVQRGVDVLERMLARQFERPIDRPQSGW